MIMEETTTSTLQPDSPARTPLWARVMSDVFSPLLVPTYAMALAMWITPLRVLPESGRLIATGAVAVITALVPFMVLMALRKLGKISNMDISNRRERMLPYTVAVVCYLCAAWTMHSYHAPHWLAMFFVAAAVATTAAMTINTVWKISAHLTAMGGLTGMFVWFTIAGLAGMGDMYWLTGSILLAGAVATARLALYRHTLGQVAAGYLLGLVCTVGLMAI